MTVTYCTADNVISFLRLYDPSTGTRWADSTTSDPTTAELEGWINDAEDHIDAVTGHAWRTVTVTDEYHDAGRGWQGFYDREMPIKLDHRKIATLSTASDKIEVWNGSSWINFATEYTEGRSDGFWIDYTNGIVYFVNYKPYYADSGVRVTYRYGDSAVPGDIEEAATKLVAIRVLESDWYKAVVPEGSGLENRKTDLCVRWREDVERILRNRRELRLIGAF